MRRQFAVIGLGMLGFTVAKALSEDGYNVIAIDKDQARVQEASKFVSVALCIDATEESAMRDAGFDHVDVAIVCIGERIEANLMATMLLKDMGIETIIVKAASDMQERLLENIGVTEIIHPERDMGLRLANRLVNPNILDYIRVSPDYDLVEVIAPRTVVNNTLSNSKIRTNYGVNVIAIKHTAQEIKDEWDINPLPEAEILEGDILLVLGRKSDIEKFHDQ